MPASRGSPSETVPSRTGCSSPRSSSTDPASPSGCGSCRPGMGARPDRRSIWSILGMAFGTGSLPHHPALPAVAVRGGHAGQPCSTTAALGHPSASPRPSSAPARCSASTSSRRRSRPRARQRRAQPRAVRLQHSAVPVGDTFDLVVANILTNPLRARPGDFGGSLRRPGGAVGRARDPGRAGRGGLGTAHRTARGARRTKAGSASRDGARGHDDHPPPRLPDGVPAAPEEQLHARAARSARALLPPFNALEHTVGVRRRRRDHTAPHRHGETKINAPVAALNFEVCPSPRSRAPLPEPGLDDYEDWLAPAQAHAARHHRRWTTADDGPCLGEDAAASLSGSLRSARRGPPIDEDENACSRQDLAAPGPRTDDLTRHRRPSTTIRPPQSGLSTPPCANAGPHRPLHPCARG